MTRLELRVLPSQQAVLELGSSLRRNRKELVQALSTLYLFPSTMNLLTIWSSSVLIMFFMSVELSAAVLWLYKQYIR